MLKAGSAKVNVWLTTDFFVVVSLFVSVFVLLYFVAKR